MLAFIFVLGLLITLMVGGMCITFYLYTHHAIGNTYVEAGRRFYNADGSDREEESQYAA